MRLSDILAIAISALLGMGGIVASLSGDSGKSCTIYTPGGSYRYTLSQYKTLDLTGLVGKVTVEISNNSVRVIQADCPNQLCRLRGFITKAGDSLVCAPNHISVKIESEAQEVDAVTQ